MPLAIRICKLPISPVSLVYKQFRPACIVIANLIQGMRDEFFDPPTRLVAVNRTIDHNPLSDKFTFIWL